MCRAFSRCRLPDDALRHHRSGCRRRPNAVDRSGCAVRDQGQAVSFYTYQTDCYGPYTNKGVTLENNIGGGIVNRTAGTMKPRENFLFGKSAVHFAPPAGTLADFLPLESAGIPEDMGATRWVREKLSA